MIWQGRAMAVLFFTIFTKIYHQTCWKPFLWWGISYIGQKNKTEDSKWNLIISKNVLKTLMWSDFQKCARAKSCTENKVQNTHQFFMKRKSKKKDLENNAFKKHALFFSEFIQLIVNKFCYYDVSFACFQKFSFTLLLK